MDWRSYVITRIKIFQGRPVSTLTPEELKGLTRWLEKVKTRWETVDAQIRVHYGAIQRAIEEAGIRRESEPPQRPFTGLRRIAAVDDSAPAESPRSATSVRSALIERLDELAKTKGLKTISEAIGVSSQTIRSWLRGVRPTDSNRKRNEQFLSETSRRSP